MDVKLMGYEWQFNQRFDAQSLYDKLVERWNRQQSDIKEFLDGRIEFNDNLEKIICISRTDIGRWIGIFMRLKDKSSFLKLIKEGNDTLTLGTQNLSENEKLTKVNFFVFDPTKNKGVYAYYHSSNWIGKFNILVREIYDELNKPERELLIRKLEEKSISKRTKRIEDSKLKPLAHAILTNEEGYEGIVRSMKYIDEISLSYKYEAIRDGEFVPYAKYSSAQNITLSISDYNSENSELKNKLLNIPRNLYKAVTVRGRSSSNLDISDIVAKLNNNYNFLSKKRYEDVYGTLSLNFSNIENLFDTQRETFNWLDNSLNTL